MRRRSALAAALALAAPAAAQEAEVHACAARGGAEAAACIGAYAEACQAAPGGETTVGIVACASAETDAWDRLLNETWGVLLAQARALDAAEAEAGDPGPDQEAMLRAAQRAWLAFRDADCAQEAAVWGGGTMGQIAAATCMMQRTATRALELAAKRDAMGEG